MLTCLCADQQLSAPPVLISCTGCVFSQLRTISLTPVIKAGPLCSVGVWLSESKHLQFALQTGFGWMGSAVDVVVVFLLFLLFHFVLASH